MESTGDKTEQATSRKLEEASSQGQFARSAEVQTVFVLAGGMMALSFTGYETWRYFTATFAGILGHLSGFALTADAMQGYCIQGAFVVAKCVWPVVFAAMVGGVLAGGMQSRFQTASDALEIRWNRIDPVAGLKRLFSFRSAAPAGIALVKLATIVWLTYSKITSILQDPIFFSAVSAGRIAQFLAETSMSIVTHVCLVLAVIAAIDYGYQFWRTNVDLMMTRSEVKEESKNSEGNPQVRALQRRKQQRFTHRQMLLNVPKADVVITNPTHLAVALRYDRKTMKAPQIIAKGSRLNALQIREIAQKHQVPIVENKPLARLMFRYGKVGGEVPAQLYAAVAEILAWVYRINRYRYYTEQNQPTT